MKALLIALTGAVFGLVATGCGNKNDGGASARSNFQNHTGYLGSCNLDFGFGCAEYRYSATAESDPADELRVAAENRCYQKLGTFDSSATCVRDGAVGYCTSNMVGPTTGLAVYYRPHTVSTVKKDCKNTGGEFSTSAP